MASKKVSLTDFANEIGKNPPGYNAWIRTIPEWPEILEAWNTGKVDQSQIRLYLIEVCGYSPDLATRSRIAYLSKQYPRRQRA